MKKLIDLKEVTGSLSESHGEAFFQALRVIREDRALRRMLDKLDAAVCDECNSPCAQRIRAAIEPYRRLKSATGKAVKP